MRVCVVLHTDLYEPWPVVRAKREVDVLRRLGRDVVVVSWIKDESTPWPIHEVRDGVRIRRVKFAPPKGGIARAMGYRRISKMFAREIAATKPNAILCHDLEMLWAAVMAGRSLRVPILYHSHEDWPAMVSERSPMEARVFARLERKLVRFVDHIYTVGEELAAKYRGWGRPVTVQYGSKSITEMPRLMDQEKSEIRRDFGFANGDVLVGIAGSLGRDEALPAILEAIAGLPERVKLFVVGGLPGKVEAAKRVVIEGDIADRVAFTGPLPTPMYLRHAAVLDLGLALFEPTSANQLYVVPLKLFDYMGLGIPVVVSDFPSMRQIVDDCGIGTTADPRSAESIAAAIRSLVEDSAKRRAMSVAALRCFETTYSWERQEEALVRSHPVFRPA